MLLDVCVYASFLLTPSAWTVVFATNYQNTITTGSLLITIVVGIFTIAVSVFGIRYREAYRSERAAREAEAAASEALRESLADERARNDRMRELLAETNEALRDSNEVRSRLEQLPNLERVLTLMADEAQRIDAAGQARAELALARITEFVDERHEAQLAALAGITARLERLGRP